MTDYDATDRCRRVYGRFGEGPSGNVRATDRDSVASAGGGYFGGELTVGSSGEGPSASAMIGCYGRWIRANGPRGRRLSVECERVTTIGTVLAGGGLRTWIDDDGRSEERSRRVPATRNFDGHFRKRKYAVLGLYLDNPCLSNSERAGLLTRSLLSVRRRRSRASKKYERDRPLPGRRDRSG